MANYCYNQVTFTGSPAALMKARLCFAGIAEKDYGLPEFCDQDFGWFFELAQKGDSISYRTRWHPNVGTVQHIAEKFGLDYSHYFEEMCMGIMGEAFRINGEANLVRLISPDLHILNYDHAVGQYEHNGQYFECEEQVWEARLQEKKHWRQARRSDVA